MKILLITPSYFPIVGGSEILTSHISKKLRNKGIYADILTYNMNQKWKPYRKNDVILTNGSRIYKESAYNLFNRLPNPFEPLFKINVFPNFNFRKKLGNYDILHYIGEVDLSLPFFSLLVNKPKLLHCVAIHENGGIYKYFKHDHKTLHKLFKIYFPMLADKYIISSIEERELINNLGIKRKDILVLPIGVDTDLFNPGGEQREDNLILFVGRIDYIKGLHILLESLLYVKNPVKLVIIGPEWSHDYVNKIKIMAHKINLLGRHKITFIGSLDQNQLAKWYQKATVVVSPYIYETYSYVTREAMSSGTPVISTGTHVMKNMPDGIIITSKNPKIMADDIDKLLNDSRLREKLGREGRNVIEKYYAWDIIINKLIKIYEDNIV